MIRNNPARNLLQDATASGAGSAIDCRHAANYGFLAYHTPADSALLVVEASHDATGWFTHSTVTATTTSASAQISDYLPFVRAGVDTRYGAASASLYYQPGLT